MPFAFGVGEDGLPDAEAETRLDKALEVARDISVEKFILGHSVHVY